MSRKETHDYLAAIHCDGDLRQTEHREVKTLLQSWIDAAKEYVQLFSESADAPWWYNERANVSILAGAAWKMGWVALEEYRSRKRVASALDAGGDGEDDNRGGRNDLYICGDRYSYVFEAKHAWQHIGRQDQANTKNLDAARSAALGDIKSLFEYEADRRFAATFVVPYLPASAITRHQQIDSDLLMQSIDSWLATLRDHIGNVEKHAYYACLFPIPRDESKHYLSANGKYCYPGVVLILDEL